jgi:oxygen-independent coproporphyrinogen-3 oxidase
VERYEQIDPGAQMAEHMLTGLRLMNEGVDAEAFAQRFGLTLMDAYGGVIGRFLDHGLLMWAGNRLRLTPRARLLSNQIFVEFFT